MSKRMYSFKAAGSCSSLNDLAEDYPLKQTQALILSIEAATDWTALARSMLGELTPEVLNDSSDWLERVDDFLQEIQDELAEDENEDLIKCRLRADETLYDTLDELLNSCPGETDGFDDDFLDEDEVALREAAVRMADFWIENVRKHLIVVLQMMSGDGEVLSMLAHYENG